MRDDTGTMPEHLYLVVNCKTRGNICAVKYHGVDIGATEIGEMAPTGFDYRCGQCQRSHGYEIPDTRIERFDFPPPAGWKSGCSRFLVYGDDSSKRWIHASSMAHIDQSRYDDVIYLNCAKGVLHPTISRV